MNFNRMSAVTESVSKKELYDVILNASSQNPALVQASTKRFKELLDLFGTYDGLHEIAADKSIPLHVRQQSIIQFKNFALNHWRSRKLLSDEQRVRIRTRCFSFLDEKDDTIAQCNEIIISRIARYDFPNNWSSLLTDLVQAIDTNLQSYLISSTINASSTLILRRSLKILNEVLKEFASIKLNPGQTTMAKIVSELHLILYGHYAKFSAFFGSLDVSSLNKQRTADDILVAHLIFKCLVKMAAWLWHQADKKSGQRDLTQLHFWLFELFQNSVVQFKMLSELRISMLLNIRSSSSNANEVTHKSIDQLTRHVLLFGKLFRRLQQLAAARFVELASCSDLILYYWSKAVQAANDPSLIGETNDSIFPLRFLVQALVLFKESLAQWTPTSKDGTLHENTLSRQFVEDAVRVLIARFIPLKPSDLDAWMLDPEGWVNTEEKENDQWEFELRPCGERVLMTLSSQYKEYVTPLLELTFKEVVVRPAIDLPSVIQKEALYCAIGRCATRLKNVIPFSQWLEHNLVSEARETDPKFPIIKRRIAWLIGKWVAEQCFSANDTRIWEILTHLLSDRGPGTDVVVRLTTATAIRECVDSTDFSIEVFAPFLPIVLTELLKIIGEVDTIETKRRLVESLNVVIERGGPRVIPFAQVIIESIPKLWTFAGDDFIFKGCLLRTATKLVESTGEHSVVLHPLVIPLISETLVPGVAVQLDADGLALWEAALRDSISIRNDNGIPSLFDLFPFAVQLLAQNLDLLGQIVSIVESYILLDANFLLRDFYLDLFRAFVAALKGQALSPNIKEMLIALNFLVQLAPSSLWGEALHISGLFAHLLRSLTDPEISTPAVLQCIHLFARISFSDAQMMLRLISATAQAKGSTESKIYEELLDEWWTRFDTMSEPGHRKLTAMGIASLVATGRPEVMKRLTTEIFNLWLDVFGEIKEAQLPPQSNGGSSPIVSHWNSNEPTTIYYRNSEGTAEYERRKTIWHQDPVRTLRLSTFIAARLQEAEAACGGSHAFRVQYLDNADPAVLSQIQDEFRQA